MNLESLMSPIQYEMPLVMQRLKGIADSDYPKIAELATHIVGGLGKGIRPALTLLSGKFGNNDLEKLIPMASAVELLHVASLVHDDTIDKAPLRRGVPTLHSVWGDGAATIAGDYLFAKSAELAAEPGNLRVVRLFARTLMDLAKGELEETISAFNWRQSREDYFRRITGKTAVLFCMATKSGAILSDCDENTIQALKNYGYSLGLAFQVVDDILDFTGDESVMGKPVGDDLMRGVLTLPAILFMEQNPGINQIVTGFKTKGSDNHLPQAIDDIRNSTYIQESLVIAEELSNKACTALKMLPSGRTKHTLVDLAKHVTERRK